MEELTIQDLLKKELWLIDAKSYGRYLFMGNEEEAEDARSGKASWEGTTATKERMSLMGDVIIDDGCGTTSLDNFIERFIK